MTIVRGIKSQVFVIIIQVQTIKTVTNLQQKSLSICYILVDTDS